VDDSSGQFGRPSAVRRHDRSIHAWAVGPGATIVASTDGGATWVPETAPTTTDLYGVTFADTADGWAVGPGGTVIATIDGGAHWAAQTVPTTQALIGVTSRGQLAWAVGAGGAIVGHQRRRRDLARAKLAELARPVFGGLCRCEQRLGRRRSRHHPCHHRRRRGLDCPEVTDHGLSERRGLPGRDARLGGRRGRRRARHERRRGLLGSCDGRPSPMRPTCTRSTSPPEAMAGRSAWAA